MTMNELLALSEEPFVRAAYRAILGRDADESGLQHYLGRLVRGDRKVSILSDLAASPEAKARLFSQDLAQLPDDVFIDTIYHRVLGRAPDGPGKESYLAALRWHRDRQRIVLDIENSPEARKRNDGSAKFKEELTELLREESATPMAWRLTLDDLLMESAETFVNATYRLILGRDADEAGLKHYLRQLDRGLGKVSVIEDLSRSAEARRRTLHQDLESLSNDAFLDVIYNRLLGRAADERGKRQYAMELERHGHRQRIVKDIQNSPEGRKHKPESEAFKRDLSAWLREQRRERSWWAWIRHPQWMFRRLNQLEHRMEIIAKRLDGISNATDSLFEKVSQNPMPRESVTRAEEALPSEKATAASRHKLSIFDILDGLPCEPSAFLSALTERIAVSEEAHSLGSANRNPTF